MLSSGRQTERVARLLSLTSLYPILDINCKDSLCAARVHSYHVSYRAGTRTGGIHTLGILKKEHTHIVKVNFIIDNLLKKSYIIVQMKGTQHD